MDVTPVIRDDGLVFFMQWTADVSLEQSGSGL